MLNRLTPRRLGRCPKTPVNNKKVGEIIMPHIKTEAQYYVKKERVIYAILSPFDKQIYVGHTLKSAVKNHYKDHRILRNRQTKGLFQEAKNRSLIPQMYLLEELDTVAVDAYRHCVAWIKYFVEHGYRSIAQKTTNTYAETLLEDTRVIYDQIKNLPLEGVLSEEKLLVNSVKNYRVRQQNEDNDTAFIGFRVTQKDEAKIRAAAEKKQWNVSEYCRAAAVDGAVVNIDFNFLWRYTQELMGVKDLLQQMIRTIHETGTYDPQDLKTIQKMVDTVLAHEKKINEDMTAVMKKAQKNIRGAKRDL